MVFTYKKVLVIGATSGIGRALAETILQKTAAKVIVTGRRVERLDAFVKEHGANGRAFAYQNDFSKLHELKGFFDTVFAEHPDTDYIVHNAGVQIPVNFHDPASVDLVTIESEVALNYTSILYLLKYATPYLLKRDDGSKGANKNAGIMLVTSGLAITPFTLCGNYSATKAAVHHLAYTLRAQFAKTNINIVELVPPAVETELHDAENHLGGRGIHPPAMTMPDFIAEIWPMIEAGDLIVAPGTAGKRIKEVEGVREPLFRAVDDMVQKIPNWPQDRAQ